jgi:H+-translocating NAD(P) transhydrogenase subunit alpha
MTAELLANITIFVLSLLVGIEVISKVPPTLHTPLMSGANAIHGIVLVGSMLVAATVRDPVGYVVAFLAMAFATANVLGGYVVTDRMLQMFRARRKPTKPSQPGEAGQKAEGDGAEGQRTEGDRARGERAGRP